jgi:hypothetical protein
MIYSAFTMVALILLFTGCGRRSEPFYVTSGGFGFHGPPYQVAHIGGKSFPYVVGERPYHVMSTDAEWLVFSTGDYFYKLHFFNIKTKEMFSVSIGSINIYGPRATNTTSEGFFQARASSTNTLLVIDETEWWRSEFEISLLDKRLVTNRNTRLKPIPLITPVK